MKKVILLLIVVMLVIVANLPAPDTQEVSTLPPTQEAVVTAPVEGDRITIVRHFEYVLDITDWRHITSNDKDKAVGVSDNKEIVMELDGDPIVFSTLAVSLDGDTEKGGQAIIEFLSKLLNENQYKVAVGLLDKGGDVTLGNRRILIYRDMDIRKAIIKIWVK